MATLQQLKEGERAVHDTLTPTLPETSNIRLNHIMLRIAEPDRSLHFYMDIFGMSLIFRFAAGPMTVYYLGYPSLKDKSPADIAKCLSTKSGLLELIHVHEERGAASGPSAYPVGTPKGRIGFGHLGFTVPSVEQLLDRAQQRGYTVLKVPEDSSETKLDLPDYVPEGSFHANFLAAYTQIGFLRDPDGYSIEIVPTVLKR